MIISFCYNVIGNQPTNEKERVYYDVAKKIAIDEISYVNVALDAPEAVYPPLRSKLSSEEDSSHIWAGIVSGNAKSGFNFK